MALLLYIIAVVDPHPI